MKRTKTNTGSMRPRGTNIVHSLDLPMLDRRRTRNRAGARRRHTESTLIPVPPPAPVPAPVQEIEIVPAQRPAPSHDSQARHQIQLLERRLLKMARLLEQKGQETVSASVPIDDGLASIYSEVQGLADGEGHVERKREMMATIFQENLKLRERVTSA